MRECVEDGDSYSRGKVGEGSMFNVQRSEEDHQAGGEAGEGRRETKAVAEVVEITRDGGMVCPVVEERTPSPLAAPQRAGWLKRLSRLFSCHHQSHTRVMRDEMGDYVRCFDCGARVGYDWENMKRL